MPNCRPVFAICALAAVLAPPALAAPGDIVVPAHRTRDGHWVPANVPPSSAGTHLTRRPSRGVAAQRTSRAPVREPLLPPLLVNAQPIRR
jgi:hypothetical protein